MNAISNASMRIRDYARSTHQAGIFYSAPPSNGKHAERRCAKQAITPKWIVLTCLLFLGSMGISQATPPDSPDTVYIGGLPCNSLCQSYMAWSRAASTSMLRSSNGVFRSTTAMRRERSKPAVHARLAKQAIPMPQARLAELPPASNPAIVPDRSQSKISDPSTAGRATANTRTIQEQVVAATTLAQRVTAASSPEQKANNTDHSDRTESRQLGDSEKIEPAPARNIDLLVALLITRPEIKSVSDLAGKDIAIEDKQSTSVGSVRSAIAAAGATEIQLSEGHAMPIDRLISGEVPAAVLTLASPEAAEWFPDIKGFKIFRIPLSPRS